MSDKGQTSKDVNKTENIQIEDKSNNEGNKIATTEGKSKTEEFKVELNREEEKITINTNGEADNAEEVRRKPRTLTIYTMFGRQPPPPQQGWFGGFPGSEPQPERPPPLNYKANHRNDFVRLVLMLVLIMLIATAGFVSMALINEGLNDFFQAIPIWLIFLPALGLLMTVHYAFICSPCAHTPPCNFVMLALTTVGMTLMVTKISVHYGTEVVLLAVLATAGIVFVCVCLACTNFDFTRFLLYVVVIATAFSLVFMIVLLVKMITGIWMKPLVITMLAIGTLIQAVLLVIEIQTVIGGGSVELTEEDYAIGAYMIYTSIINIFLNLVQIIGLSSD